MDSFNFERALIASILQAPETMTDLEVQVLPSDFSVNSHQVVWEKIIPLSSAGQLSKVALVETLRACGLLENLGQDVGSVIGAAYIDQLCELASPNSTAFFGNQVIDASIKRQMGVSIALTRMDLEENRTADEILDSAEGRLWEMRRQKSEGGDDISALLDVLDLTIDDYRADRKQPAYVVRNPDLARIIPFLEDQDYMIIGGRPGDGKSSWLRSELFQCAQDGQPVCIINMDNGELDYSRYLVAFETGINSKKLRNPKTLSNAEHALVKETIARLKSYPIRIVTMGSPTGEMVLSAMKKAVGDGFELFGVDYVQQVQNKGLADNPVQNISITSNLLSGFAKKYHKPVVAASQFSREIVHRGKDAKPNLSDFKGSGSLEQDATIAVAINLPDQDPTILGRFPENLVVDNHGRKKLASSDDIRAVIMELYVLKQRNGPIGKTNTIKWDKAINRYTPLDLAATPPGAERREVPAYTDV